MSIFFDHNFFLQMYHAQKATVFLGALIKSITEAQEMPGGSGDVESDTSRARNIHIIVICSTSHRHSQFLQHLEKNKVLCFACTLPPAFLDIITCELNSKTLNQRIDSASLCVLISTFSNFVEAFDGEKPFAHAG